jgi:hypothetical protein
MSACRAGVMLLIVGFVLMNFELQAGQQTEREPKMID